MAVPYHPLAVRRRPAMYKYFLRELATCSGEAVFKLNQSSVERYNEVIHRQKRAGDADESAGNWGIRFD